MSYDVKKLAEDLGTLLSNTVDDIKGVDHTKPIAVLGGAGSRIEIRTETGQVFTGAPPDEGPPTLYILQEGALAEQSFIDECLKDRDFALQIGGKAISARLREIVKSNYCSDAKQLDLPKIVKEDILKLLRSEVSSWRVRVPIANLRLQSPITVGRVAFSSHDEGVVAITKILMDHEGPPHDIDNVAGKAMLLKVLGAVSQQGSTWATVEVESHKARIKDVAREYIEAAVNVVRAFTHIFFTRGQRVGFGLPYELTSTNTGFIAKSETTFVIESDRRGFFMRFDVTDELVSRLKAECFFNRLSEIAGKPWGKLNSLERAIRVACHWLGRAPIAPTFTDSFTHCAIALERLMIVDGEETTVERFADRITYLATDDGEQRKALHKTAKRLYDIRSKIVHAGFQSVEEDELAEIEGLAIHTLIKTAELAGQLTDHPALKSLLHDRKMGIAAVSPGINMT